MKKVGIIGGMGPFAANKVAELILEYDKVENESNYLETILYNANNIPDRTQYLLGLADANPYPIILEIMQKLENIGAEIIIIPCITAHFFREKIAEKCNVIFIDIVEEIIKEIRKNNIKKIGIWATEGTLKTGFLDTALRKNDIETILPDEEIQNILMDIIYNYIKLGKTVNKTDIELCQRFFLDQGCETILLGCTELSLLDMKVNCIDPLIVLAKKSIELARN